MKTYAKEHNVLLITDLPEFLVLLQVLPTREKNFFVWWYQNGTPPEDLQAYQFIQDSFSSRKFEQKFGHLDKMSIIVALKYEKKLDTVKQSLEKLSSNLQSVFLDSVRKSEPQVDASGFLHLSWSEFFGNAFKNQIRYLESAHALSQIRHLTKSKKKLALLLQTDPDPDGIASALALRTLLKRTKHSAPILSFGHTTRPENLNMLRLLGLEVQCIHPKELDAFECLILLDTQPKHLNLKQPVDIIIDHHPLAEKDPLLKENHFLDIRPHYGATSTILTEYLMSAQWSPGRRLATALAYGIKTDTMSLNREVHEADLNAFVSVYPYLHYNLLRRIDRPCFPKAFPKVLGTVLQNLSCEEDIFCACLGPVEREDLIPQIADFLLQFENIHWSICVGQLDASLSISVRNVGYVQNAGDVIKKALGELGQGGGHRTMGKYLISQEDWLEAFGSLKAEKIQEIVLKRFAEVLREREHQTPR